MNFRKLVANLLASAIAAMGMMGPAHAVITTETVHVTCGPACVIDRNRMEMDILEQLNDLEANLRASYASRIQWNDFYDEVIWIAGYSLDLRCFTSAATVVQLQYGGVNASYALNVQKQAAEAAFQTMKNGMTPNQFNKWVADLPVSSGTYSQPGMGSFTAQKITTIVWPSNMSQSSFTVIQSGSGWVIGQHAGWKGSVEPAQCPV